MSGARDLAPDQHIDPVAWAELQHRKYATSLKCWWSREYGYLCLLEPWTGEVIEVAYEEAPKWVVYRAFDEKRRQGGVRQQGVAGGVRRPPEPGRPHQDGLPGPAVPPGDGDAEEAVPLRLAW